MFIVLVPDLCSRWEWHMGNWKRGQTDLGEVNKKNFNKCSALLKHFWVLHGVVSLLKSQCVDYACFDFRKLSVTCFHYLSSNTCKICVTS